MIPIRDLFESHLTVADLQRSMKFFGDVLGLELALVVPERKAAFYWVGGRGKSMLGVWEAGSGPQRMSLHIAFTVELADLLDAPERLRAANVTPLDFACNPTDEPDVLAWMPAASVFFHDPDGNLLEFITMLSNRPQPELGAVGWSEWTRRQK
ncbi:MAG: VOC family protein [Candidatus Acidiferrales bacterium]